jgi:hypothetical protein
MKNDEQFKQLINKIESVDNILVTVSRNPSVDELTAALALSLALNQLKKRSVAVFSGQIPSVMHFLDPEKTFESNADSLRDFIISISKDKADRLRVLPEGNFVKVYITPYRTTITKDDLQFSEGDFNVQLVIAFGVTDRNDLDASIASHGRIFHNAVAATINLSRQADNLGSISLQDIESGCYSASCYRLIKGLDSGKHSLVNSAVATALLTGIVSATDQFRNNVTSPNIMTVSAELMTKGADPQLVSSELEGKSSERREIINDTPSDDISNNASLSFSREQMTPSAPENLKESTQETVKDNVESRGDKRYTLEGDNNTPEHLDNPIERRLWQDTMAVNQENSDDALKAAQAQLAAKSNSTLTPSQLKEPEVVRLAREEPAQSAMPANRTEVAQIVEPATPKPEPTILSVTPMSGQTNAPANDPRYSGPSVSTPPLNVPKVQMRDNGLPFNESNQISPIRPIFNNAPSTPNVQSTQPAPVATAPQAQLQTQPAVPAAATSTAGAPASQPLAASSLPMPPEPPAPANQSQFAGMPPVQDLQPVVKPDPAQFVIPGK